jgi:preprotein translocase subunit YajC
MKTLLLSLLMMGLVLPSTALAAAGPSPIPSFIMLGLFIVIFYFLLWRPQAKRQKEHKSLMASLNKGDEVVTVGGVAGKITKVTDDFVVVEVADNVELKVQKSSVSATLVKGTLKQIV